MKKIILLFIGILIFGCSKKDKSIILKNSIEDLVKKGMNDPNSYEFDNFLCDSVPFKVREELVAKNNRIIKEFNSKKTDDLKKAINNLIAENYTFKKLSPYKLTGSFSFRGNNKFGAKILAEYKFWADDDFKLIYLISNTNDTIYKDYEVIIKETDELLKSDSIKELKK